MLREFKWLRNPQSSTMQGHVMSRGSSIKKANGRSVRILQMRVDDAMRVDEDDTADAVEIDWCIFLRKTEK
jgi:hypothetical protein